MTHEFSFTVYSLIAQFTDVLAIKFIRLFH